MATKLKIKKKPVAKKVSTEKKFTKSIEIIDWSKVPSGTYFKGKYYGKPMMGRIKKQNNAIYLIQNCEGNRKNIFKMKFEKYLCNVKDLIHNEGTIKDIQLLSKRPDNFGDIEIEIMQIAGRQALVFKGYIAVGCQRIENSKIRELVKMLKD